MYGSQYPWFILWKKLIAYRGGDAYDEVLEPWLDKNQAELLWLETIPGHPRENVRRSRNEDLCRLYAVFRVTSLLLLRFQSSRVGSDYSGPEITLEGFEFFHEQLGFRVIRTEEYHPFHHEILSVTQESEPSAPVILTGITWPGLMLGDMMFCRAGCRVSAGAGHVVKEIAEASKLYWAYRRLDRPYEDLSHGWGHNSQWRTCLRRDYRTDSGYHYNVDAEKSLNDVTDWDEAISVPEMIELVRNRCLVKSAVDDADLFPYRYSLIEQR